MGLITSKHHGTHGIQWIPVAPPANGAVTNGHCRWVTCGSGDHRLSGLFAAKSMLVRYQWRHITKRYGKMYMEYMLVQHITHYMESELRQNNIVIYLQDHERTRAETNATFKCFKSCSMTSSLLTPKAPYAAKALGFPDLSFAAGGWANPCHR